MGVISQMTSKVLNDRYELGQFIETGEMTDVYLATDRQLERTVAVKILHRQYADNPAYVERFRRDAEAATNLKHPNVVEVYDWGIEDDLCYVVMEYVREISLHDIVLRIGPLAPGRGAEITIAACSAVEAAHTRGIMHSDIRPDNILITGDNRVRVTGFGIARPPGESRSDLYSLGSALYEGLTGRKPAGEKDTVADAGMRTRPGPPPPSSLNREVPAALDAVVMKALSGNPETRYHSVRAMRADLEEYIGGSQTRGAVRTMQEGRLAGVVSGAGGAAGRAVEAVRSRRWLWIGLIVVAVLALVGTGLGIWAASGGPSGISVPNLTGKTPQEAAKLLTEAQLKPGKVTTVVNTSVQPGTIISQKPKAGTSALQNAKVDMVISGGPELVEVPECRSLSQSEAATRLTDAGLKVGGITQDYSPDIQAGKVSAQSPEAGTQAAPGTIVALTISKGMQMVTVPKVTGMSKTSAVSQLKSKGLVGEVQEVQSATQTQNVVFEQEPQAGQSVGAGSVVVLRVAVKPKMVSVPNVVGLSLDAARTKILGAKLNVGFDGSPQPTDRVVRQEPASGTQVGENTEVKLFFQ